MLNVDVGKEQVGVVDGQIKLKDVDNGLDKVDLAMGEKVEVFDTDLDAKVVGEGCLEAS